MARRCARISSPASRRRGARWHARLDASGIRHADYVLDQPLDLPLRRLFGARDAAEYA